MPHAASHTRTVLRVILLSLLPFTAAQGGGGGGGASGPTFGNGLAGVAVCGASQPPTVILNYTLPAGAAHGVLHHFWITGERGKVDRAWIDYFVDGEASPSISFQPAFMCGAAFPQLLSHDYEFSAGGLCGKTAPVGGWSNVFAIPFYQTVLVTARGDPSDGAGCFGAYLNVRGTVGLPLVAPGSGRPLPFGTRTLLQANALATRQPLEFVVVAELPTGTRGEVFLVSWAVEAQPAGGAGAGGGYIEGCWNFKPTAAEPYPGVVVGTGVEDYFDSGCVVFPAPPRRRAHCTTAPSHTPTRARLRPPATTLAPTRATRRASSLPTRCRG